MKYSITLRTSVWHCIVGLLLATACSVSLGKTAPTADRFERISPQQANYSNEKLAELSSYLQASGASSMLLLHDGKVVFEWGDIRKKHLVHSIRKALLNALLGIEVDNGQLHLDSTLKQLGVQDRNPKLNASERQATLRMLLQSRSGIYHPATAESEGMQAQKPVRGSHRPGAHFYYNNWDFNALGAIYQKASGKSIYQAFDEYIAKPLGMLDYQGNYTRIDLPEQNEIPQTDGFYQYEKSLSQFPAYHFRLSAHDLALFGQLYLNRGNWNGVQIISQDWISKSTQPYSITDEKYGLAYGMLWSVLLPDAQETAPPSFYHTGTGVHMLGVYPKHKLVMVLRVDTEKAYSFHGGNLYSVIKMMHAARQAEQ